MKSILSSILILLLGIVSSCTAQGISDELNANIQSRIDNRINTSIVIGIVSSEDTQYYSYGVKSYQNNAEADENSVFEIGSISKTFTGILLADRVVKGQLSLDDPIEKLMPEGVSAPMRNGESIRLYQLSNHTSGIPRLPSNMSPANPANPYADYTETMMLEFLNNLELSRDIGSKYEYSNFAVGLLGYVLAADQGMTYEELMIKSIAKPLGMKNTSIALSSKMSENLAKGHSGGVEVDNWDIPALAGAGAIRSTAADMTKFLAANMGIKKSKLYPAMQLSHKNTRDAKSKPSIGLGWHILERDNLSIIWHNGGTGGYRTFAGFIEDGDLGVVVLSNSDVGVDDIGLYLMDSTTPLANPKPNISTKIRSIIEEEGIDAAITVYRELKKNEMDAYDFSEINLNALGYSYLQSDETEKALALLKLNTESFPNSSNVYDSYGEALMKNSQNELAIVNYKKSVELNPGNTNAIEMLKKLGVDTDNLVENVVIADEVLESYVGKYELAPGFILSITKDGSQMYGQATGQGSNPIYPKSQNVFYLKVVDAQLQFNSKDEKIESVTLFQAGQEIVGKKLEE